MKKPITKDNKEKNCQKQAHFRKKHHQQLNAKKKITLLLEKKKS